MPTTPTPNSTEPEIVGLSAKQVIADLATHGKSVTKLHSDGRVEWIDPESLYLTPGDADREYLEQASAHADEGPLGEPAARSILRIALRLLRAQTEAETKAAEDAKRIGELETALMKTRECNILEPTSDVCPRHGHSHAALNGANGNG